MLAKRPIKKAYKRKGGISNQDKEIVANIVTNNPGEMSPTQITGLARALKRSPAVIKQMVLDARERFVGRAGMYVDIHAQATAGALATGDLEQALKGSQWALSNISGEGARVVDRASEGASGSKVLIGIKVGSVDSSAVKVETHE